MPQIDNSYSGVLKAAAFLACLILLICSSVATGIVIIGWAVKIVIGWF